ncbi:MAG: DUF1824 family protein [Pseudanabaena sp.]
MSNNLTIADAERILWELSDLDQESATSERRSQICEALDYLTKQADYHIFGICADTTAEALQALQNYADHFRYELPNADLSAIIDGVYLKYNPRSRRYHLDNYKGAYRGVLISLQTDFTEGYSGPHGNFTLYLF